MAGLPDWIVDPRVVWFLIGLSLLVAEFFIPGLVVFFFGIGAWAVVLALSVVRFGLGLQVLIFLAASVAALMIFRRWFKDHLYKNKGLSTGESDYLGKRVVVIKEIKQDLKGKIELYGSYWDAVADVPVAAGEVVEIVSKDNITFKVVPVP